MAAGVAACLSLASCGSLSKPELERRLLDLEKNEVVRETGLERIEVTFGPADAPVRSNVAMTGEITLRGEVLPIGGLKEKLLAAHRGGIDTVLIPDGNEKDLTEIPKNIKDKLTILPVKWIDEVFEHALQHLPVPDRGGEVGATERDSKAEEGEKSKASLPH